MAEVARRICASAPNTLFIADAGHLSLLSLSL
jgi:hypothetical protein